eukprot:g27697.t1
MPASSQDTSNSPFSAVTLAPFPHLFLLYIDDCIDTASCSHEDLEKLINLTNTFHPNLKFTWTISNTSLPFLGLCLSISGIHLYILQFGLLYPLLPMWPPLRGEVKRKLGDHFMEHLRSVRENQQHLPVSNHFNSSSSHSLGDMSILGLLQCHHDATRKLEEQHLIFRLGSLQPNGLN